MNLATAIAAVWAITCKFGKATQARAILSKMVERHESGAIPGTPNTHCHVAVINSCACSKNKG
jgi:hypothetical protein